MNRIPHFVVVGIATIVLIYVVVWITSTTMNPVTDFKIAAQQPPRYQKSILDMPVTAAWTGQVKSVYDGDTVQLTNPDDQNVWVHLEGIRAPKLGQSGVYDSRDKLQNYLTVGGYIFVYETGRNGKGEPYAFLIRDAEEEPYVNFNLEMVRCGQAWHDTERFTSTILASAEQEARDNKVAIWAR